MTYEGIRLKFNKYRRQWLSKIRRRKINCTDFTIISNNCWGGTIYESYNLVKKTPTVGLFFMADDYIRFVKNFDEYIATELKFISANDSKWKKELSENKNFGVYPIGILNDIEIHFLHYHSEKEAMEKWKRRCQRINKEKILFKFNDQNGCTEKHIREFDSLPYKNKICFSVKKYPSYSSVVTIRAPKSHKFIRASYEPFGEGKYINMNDVINRL